MIRRLVPAVALLVLVGYPVVAPGAVYYQTVLLMAFLVGIQAIGWNIVSGFAGYISLGHSVFLGIGAYTAGIGFLRWGINPLVLAPVGGLVAAAVALGIGGVVLRAKGPAFVIITIALLLVCQLLAVNLPAVTNGSDGITLGFPFWDPEWGDIPFYYLFLALLVASFGFSAWIRRSRFGTGLLAIREDEGKAAAIGVPTSLYKTLAYAASAFFVGVAGAVYAYYLTFLNPVGAFNILTSVTVVLAAMAGGRGTLYGPVLGAFIVSFASEAATVYAGGTQSRVLLFGLALVVIVLFLPDGLLPTVDRLLARRRAEPVEFLELPAIRSAATEPVRPDPMSGPLLEIRQAHKAFGGIQALGGVDLAVPRGSITGLIGPNGSGKTTLFNVISGTSTVDKGEILLDGQRIERLRPWRRAHCGLGRTFQVTRLFTGMTVLENVLAPLPGFTPRVFSPVGGPEADRAGELLAAVGLERFAGQRAGSLSYGQQKLVELAQVLMLEPRMVLLDEPAGGITPALVDRLTEIIRQANRQGVTFLVVEHNIPMVLDLCDPIFVLAAGEVIAHGEPDRIRSDTAVRDAYLGREVLL